MRYAAGVVSARAHIRAMEVCRPGLFEYHLEAELECTSSARAGRRCRPTARSVAAGRNATILHYRENDAAIKDGDLILIDAGCEIDCYASDITRTFPANGASVPSRRRSTNSCWEANMAAFDYIAPGRHWNEAHEATVRVITAGLVRLGLLEATSTS
ncbi:M24 family metallopeptidase [Pseudomonas aeruginosa]